MAQKIRTYSKSTELMVGHVARAIKQARKEKRMSEHELADRIGIARSTLQRLERGDAVVEFGIVLEAALVVGLNISGVLSLTSGGVQGRGGDPMSTTPSVLPRPSQRERVKDDF